MFTYCVGTALYSTLLNEDRIKDRSEGKTRIKTKQLLDKLKDTIGYWQLKEEALARTLWGTRFGRCCGSVIRLFCGTFISYSPGMLYMQCLNDFEIVPVVPISTGITFTLPSITTTSPTRKETRYSDQNRDLFNTLPTKLNTLLSPLF